MTKTAPCGCRFEGRVDYTEACTVIGLVDSLHPEWSGRERLRHRQAARRKAK